MFHVTFLDKSEFAGLKSSSKKDPNHVHIVHQTGQIMIAGREKNQKYEYKSYFLSIYIEVSQPRR